MRATISALQEPCMLHHLSYPMPDEERYCVEYGERIVIAGNLYITTYHVFHRPRNATQPNTLADAELTKLWGTGFTITHDARDVIQIHLSEAQGATFDELLRMSILLLRRDPRSVYVLAETLHRMLSHPQ